GKLRPFVADGHPILRPGWQLMSLIPRATLDAAGSQRRNGGTPGTEGGESGSAPGPAPRRLPAAQTLRGHSAHERQPAPAPAPDRGATPGEGAGRGPDDADPGAGPAAA